MTIHESTSDTTKFAAANDMTFGFVGSKGGSIEMVGVSSNVEPSRRAAVASYAAELASSLGNASDIIRETLKGAAVATVAGVAATGDISPFAFGVGGMAGVISSISKGGRSV